MSLSYFCLLLLETLFFPPVKQNKIYGTFFVVLFVWCCRVCQTKIEYFFASFCGIFGVLNGKVFVGRISAQLMVLAMMLHTRRMQFSHSYSPLKANFIHWIGNFYYLWEMSLLLCKDTRKAIDIHRFMYDGFQPDEQRWKGFSLLLVQVEESWLICQLEKVKTLNVFCSLCSDIA